MNTHDVLRYGHLTVVSTLEGLPHAYWETPNVCGVWSVKDIIAHLASFEHLLVDVLLGFIDKAAPTPTLNTYAQSGARSFNDSEVAKRQGLSPQAVYDEYASVCAQAQALASQISPVEQMRAGTLPWYGAEYDLQDFVVYTFYGHKREHCAQIAVYTDTLDLCSL